MLRLLKTQGIWQVHKSTDTLLAVPQYSDLLNNQDDENESECGQLLVLSRQGWRMEMAKWITEVQAAELDKDDSNNLTSWLLQNREKSNININ